MKEVLKDLIRKNGYWKVLQTLQEAELEVCEEDAPKREQERLKRKAAAKKRKEKVEQRAEEFKKIVKVGDVVKMEGTRDRQGYRLVLECNSNWITCRKLKKTWYKTGSGATILHKDSYITDHYWTKVKEIVDPKYYKLL